MTKFDLKIHHRRTCPLPSSPKYDWGSLYLGDALRPSLAEVADRPVGVDNPAKPQ